MLVRCQAVRLPLAYRLPGDRVRVRRVENGILLEPMVTDVDSWFTELDRFVEVPFMEEGVTNHCYPRSNICSDELFYGIRPCAWLGVAELGRRSLIVPQ